MRHVVRNLSDLGEDLVFAPERWLSTQDLGEGTPLGDLVVERRERAKSGALVLDTTHAKDGLLDIYTALRSPTQAKSAKKSVQQGELIISRLRPYLRQIAYVHPKALELTKGRPLALSTEFYVLAPKNKEDIAFLVPFLLSPKAQSILAAAQEGGHHPRVPLAQLLALRIPRALLANRRAHSSKVKKALTEHYEASAKYQALLSDEPD